MVHPRRPRGSDVFPNLQGAELQADQDTSVGESSEGYVLIAPSWPELAEPLPTVWHGLPADDLGIGHLDPEARASLTRMIDHSTAPSAVQAAAVETLLDTLRTRLRAEDVAIVPGTEAEVASQMLAALPRARSTRAAEVIGPCYDTGGLTSWLGISKQAIDKRRRRCQLLGLQQEGRWAYPAWQFTAAGQPLPGLTAVLTALSRGTTDSWAWALWMSASLPEQLEGKSVWQWLQDGGSVDEALTLARRDAASWSAA